MEIIYTIILLLIGAFLLAFRSMKDIGFSRELEQTIKKRKMKGTIVFFKDKIVHYSSKSSSS
jgi:hypothetical protein